MSESEEMYLITVAQLSEEVNPVPLSLLATELSVQPVSVNQMIRKLDDTGLVRYLPYKGVELSPTGQERADQILRHRRLWEFFLVEKLLLSIPEADALACRLEHITPALVADRLSNYLGDPLFSPQGKPIPHINDTTNINLEPVPLYELSAGNTGQIVEMEVTPSIQRFLEASNLRPGAKFLVLGATNQGKMLIRSGELEVDLDPDLSTKILVFDVSETNLNQVEAVNG